MSIGAGVHQPNIQDSSGETFGQKPRSFGYTICFNEPHSRSLDLHIAPKSSSHQTYKKHQLSVLQDHCSWSAKTGQFPLVGATASFIHYLQRLTITCVSEYEGGQKRLTDLSLSLYNNWTLQRHLQFKTHWVLFIFFPTTWHKVLQQEQFREWGRKINHTNHPTGLKELDPTIKLTLWISRREVLSAKRQVRWHL